MINIVGTDDQVTVLNLFKSSQYHLGGFRFSDGATLTLDELAASNPVYNVISGNESDNTLTGVLGNNVISGGAGNDVLNGQSKTDQLLGEAGDDYLYGNGGNDYLEGGDGSDIYYFATNGGADIINNQSSTSDNQDVLQLSGIEEENLWFTRYGDHLLIDVIGSDDQITVQDWFNSDAQKLDEIRTGDSVLLANKVESLVSAMAAFGAPPAGGADLSKEVRDEITPVITASWQAA
ncbi:hypothetical protein ACH42_05320 [Endozoicomonas sp. (ex Bugula neritina AB1)]|nr:hypothetical protein ACH42_05320 [Endozoicomonas sp. (ex Bugula neritina AB1)]